MYLFLFLLKKVSTRRNDKVYQTGQNLQSFPTRHGDNEITARIFFQCFCILSRYANQSNITYLFSDRNEIESENHFIFWYPLFSVKTQR